MYKGRHLHIQKPNVEISDDESPGSEVSIFMVTPNTKGVCECKDRSLAKKSKQNNKKEFKTSDRRGEDSHEEDDTSDLTLQSKTVVNLKKD